MSVDYVFLEDVDLDKNISLQLKTYDHPIMLAVLTEFSCVLPTYLGR